MRQTDLNILTSSSQCYGVLLVAMVLCGTADFCNASDSQCDLQIPSTTTVRSFRQKCYHFIKDEMYWTTARNFCTKYGARLAKNDDEETNDFLSTSLNSIAWWQNEGVWIGLHDRNKEFQWEWTNGKTGVDESVNWTNWASGHPSSVLHTRRNCVRMKRSHGKWLWVDTPCEMLRWHYRFICEYEFPESDVSNAPESSDATKLEGDTLHEKADEAAPTGFYHSGIILIVLLTLSIVLCCLCNIYVLCQRHKTSNVGAAVGIWPFSVLLGRRTTPVARAEPNTYVTLEMLAIGKPTKPSSSVTDHDVVEPPEETLYCPMDGSSQRHQHSVYLPMQGNAGNLSGRINTINDKVSMDSTILGPRLSDVLYWDPGPVAMRDTGNELSDILYWDPGPVVTRETGDELVGYDVPPRPQPVHLEPRTASMAGGGVQPKSVQRKDSAQRENAYETINGWHEPTSGTESDEPETWNKELDACTSSAAGKCREWGNEGPHWTHSNHLYSEISEADVQGGHIYELLDDVKTQLSPKRIEGEAS